MALRRESDQLLERLRTLVRDRRRENDARRIELKARNREIEHLKTELAGVAKRPAAMTTSGREVRG